MTEADDLLADVQFPDSARMLFDVARWKVMYGGRGGGKTWNMGRAALVLAMQKPMLFLCCREIFRSIKDSVHGVLKSQIGKMGLSEHFQVFDTQIIGSNGSRFIFAGLYRNIDSIKGTEDVDVCWVDEAANVSENSWQTLIPTIRKPGSEIWVSFNPALDSDPAYKRFVLTPEPEVIAPPLKAIVRKVSWRDNPFFTEENRAEMETDRRRDADVHLHIWEGFTRKTIEGAIYANQLRAAEEEGRISRVPHIAGQPVTTFWDLGHADFTSIWFAQRSGFEWHMIDFLQNNLVEPDFYWKAIQSRGYVYHQHVLPHDADNATTATGKMNTFAAQMRRLGMPVRVLPRLGVADGIALARTLFPRIWFDEVKCADGLNSLRRYRFDVDPITKAFSDKPLHDEHSHAADAFRYFATGVVEPKTKERKQPDRPRSLAQGGGGWMGS